MRQAAYPTKKDNKAAQATQKIYTTFPARIQIGVQIDLRTNTQYR
jgi:hypothetical protein